MSTNVISRIEPAVPTSGVTAVLVHTHLLTRSAMRYVLESKGIRVIGESGTLRDARSIVRAWRPDVVIAELDIAGEPLLPVLPALRAASAHTRVLVVAPRGDLRVHARALEAGAAGVVLMEHSADELASAIHTVHRGHRSNGHASPSRVPRRLVDVDPEAAKIRSLTRREREIVGLVGEGLNNQHIAERLSISRATARNHLTSILDKLDLVNRFQLAVYAFRHGLVTYPQPATPAMPAAALVAVK